MKIDANPSLTESPSDSHPDKVNADEKLDLDCQQSEGFSKQFDPNKRAETDDFTENLSYDDYMTIFEGLDHYNFSELDGIEKDAVLMESLKNFLPENWAGLSMTEKKTVISDFAGILSDRLSLSNPPVIGFFSEDSTKCGYYLPADNRLCLNERYIGDSFETVDTVAHELRHAYQAEKGLNPSNKLEAMYAENFRNYVSTRDDFEGYQSQLVESEASAYASRLQDTLKALCGGEM